ncbi:putative lipoxygenase 8, chloroplastic [Asimina triloba]
MIINTNINIKIIVVQGRNRSHLPSQTPSGLKGLREKELRNLRGDGEGERKSFERIYDYDVYDDLGNPDVSDELKRPVLGGSQRPYPRRCRTGRPKSQKDPESETRSLGIYVPRDEQFSGLKQAGFTQTTVASVGRSILQSLDTVFANNITQGFDFFTDIEKLFDEGFDLGPPPTGPRGIYRLLLPRLVKAIRDRGDDILKFDTPAMMERDRFAWLRDEEFGRQMLAGLNPYSIRLVTEFPFVSKLDPKIYGPRESAITKEIIERQIKGCMTVEEAVKQKRLFVLDYHDLLLPYVNMVRDLERTTLYGSRTVFFLTNEGTLQPLAIELTRPVSPTKPQWKKAFTPSSASGSTTTWLWKFAKAHVSAHDLGYHELVSHWLRTHASVEPYIIAVNRQLSAMHPIHRLMRPHLRYTMAINALARGFLINAAGIIELSFSTKKYSMQLSADAYAESWRFDMEGLPADLIRRGMAVEDPTAAHGLRLTIEDYPFAADGLLIWSAIQQWVTDYVAHYYPKDEMVSSDTELQAWWTEVRIRGHGDKKDEPWWPTLTTPKDLTQVLTTIIWVASAHHAAVNFGQYDYGGYFPNRPSILRTNMPIEDASEEQLKRFWETPERALLEGLPSQFQATLVMAVLNLLSTHSQDEEYLGKLPASAWSDNPAIGLAFENFKARLEEIEWIIDERNRDRNLRNRSGVGMIPYELMKPFSKPGVTGMGIPNSTSI